MGVHWESINWLLFNSLTKMVPIKGTCRQKVARIVNLFMIIAQICPFLTRKHLTALISCKYCLKNRERAKNIQELYPLVLACPWAAQKGGQKMEKSSKRLRIAHHLHQSELKRIHGSNTKKSKLMKHYFKVSIIKIFSKWKNLPKFKQINFQ